MSKGSEDLARALQEALDESPPVNMVAELEPEPLDDAGRRVVRMYLAFAPGDGADRFTAALRARMPGAPSPGSLH